MINRALFQRYEQIIGPGENSIFLLRYVNLLSNVALGQDDNV